jgi:hypothetical protein
MRIKATVLFLLHRILTSVKARLSRQTTRQVFALAGKSLFAAVASCVIAVSAFAGNAHCRCEITCIAADGKTFTRTNTPFPDYTQGLESERNRCESSCNQWVGSSIQDWSEQEKVCGGVNCSGTSHVGDEPRKKWKNVAGAQHNRLCCPTSNGQGCPPAVCTEITSVFRLIQTGDVTTPYRLIYDGSMKPCLDAAFQAYASYVATQVPGMTHMWVGYRIDAVAPGPLLPPHQVGWFAVNYAVGGGGGAPITSVIDPPLVVGQTYEITRGLFFNDAQDQSLLQFGDPSCKLPTFKIIISVTVSKGAAPRGSAVHRAVATITVDGQPDRQVMIDAETPAERDRRLELQSVPSPRSETFRPPVKLPDTRQR